MTDKKEINFNLNNVNIVNNYINSFIIKTNNNQKFTNYLFNKNFIEENVEKDDNEEDENQGCMMKIKLIIIIKEKKLEDND